MSAYVISEVEMRDFDGFEVYRALAAKTIAQYGGRYILRGGKAELAEGNLPPKAIVIVEFPTMARLKEWYASPEYAEALKLRQTALERRLMFVEAWFRSSGSPLLSLKFAGGPAKPRFFALPPPAPP